MKIARIKIQKEFVEALENRKNFPELYIYLSDFRREDDEIITEVRNGNLNFELTLRDYFFNVSDNNSKAERESLWKKVNGKITWEILKIVEI